MKRTTLTGRERVLRMLERRDHDRIPRHDNYWPETLERWRKEGFVGEWDEALAALGSDFVNSCWCWPVPYPGREEILEENAETKVVRGSMGKVERVWKNRWGTPEHISFGCDSAEIWHKEYKPALLNVGLCLKPIEAAKRYATLAPQEKFCTMQGVESFEAIRQLVGDEIGLIAMATEPEWVRDMSATYTDLIIQNFQAVLDAGTRPEDVWVFGDVGYNHGTLFSPAMYRELIWPDHKRLCDWSHAHGMKFIYHTDGDVREFLDLFVEAGYDCLQPMEAKAGMNLLELAPKYGRRLSFFGNIDMTVAITGDREKIENEVRTKLAAGMANRGYAYHSDHSVPPQVSWKTYQLIIELVDRYGYY